MSNNDQITIKRSDLEKILGVLSVAQQKIAELLEEELTRASIVPDEGLPSDVVAMNSKVRFKDLYSGKESDITLVYPHEANIDEGKISILTPIGSALIGLKVGQTIRWPFPNGFEKKIQVLEVTNSPILGEFGFVIVSCIFAASFCGIIRATLA